MIADKVQSMIAEAMKARDEIRLSTMRLLSSALNYEKIAKQHDLSEEEELAVIKKEAKKRKDAIEAYTKAGATERAEKETKELHILQEFLPEEMSDEELGRIVDETISHMGAKSMVEMGKVMGAVMSKLKGGASGDRVSAVVRQKLT